MWFRGIRPAGTFPAAHFARARAFDHTLGFPGEGPPRLAGGATAILTANANCVATLLADVLPGCTARHIVLAQETRLAPELQHGELPADRFAVRALAAGWRACQSEAYATGRGGHGGGVAILWPPHLEVCPVGPVVAGRAVAVTWSSARLGDVTVVSLYGVCGGGIAGNRSLWQDVGRFLAAVGKPFIVGGDFNVSPAEAAVLAAEAAIPGAVYAPGAATCIGVVDSEIDFFLVHRRLAAVAAPAPWLRMDLPIAPHRAVELSLDAAAARARAPVMVRPRPPRSVRAVYGPSWACPAADAAAERIRAEAAALAAAALADTGGATRPWTADESTAVDAWWAAWFPLAEAELSAATGGPVALTREWTFPQRDLGDAVGLARPSGRRPLPSRLLAFYRGRLLDARAALQGAAGLPARELASRARAGIEPPLVDPPPPGPRRAAAASRLGDVLAAAFHTSRSPWALDLLRRAPPEGVEVFAHWRRVLRGAPGLLRAGPARFREGLAALGDLAERCRALADAWALGEWALRRADWASIAADSLAGAARPAHRMSRLADPAPPGNGSAATQLAQATATWASMWRAADVPASFADRRVPVGPPPSAADLAAAARTFPAATAAPDGCSPRHFALLSPGLLAALAALLHLAEIGGGYAPCLEQLVIRLIPKRSGGFRPISLFRSVARLHFRHLAERARLWERSGQGACPAFNNSPGRRILDTTYRECVRHALAGSGAAIEVLLDLTKAFDQVDRALLWAAAETWGYPLAPLRLALAAYAWPRRLVGDFMIASPSLLAARGIAAGSPFATFELKALLLGVVLPVLAARPGMALSVHVDDFTVPARASSPGEAVRLVVPAVLDVVQRLQAVGLSVAPDKTEVVATPPSLGPAVRAALRAEAEARGLRAPVGPDPDGPQVSVRKLGVDLTLARAARPPGGRRGRPPAGRPPRRRPLAVITPVKAGRLAAHARRVARCRLLFGRVRFRKIMRTGLLPAALHAPEFSVYTPAEVHALRVSTLVAEGLAAPGVAHAAAWALLPAAADPAFLVHAAPVVRFGREAWLTAGRLDFPGTTPADVLTPEEIVAAAHLASGEPPPGPLASLSAGLAWFRLALRGTVLQRDGRPWADLALCPPALLRRALAGLRDDEQQDWVDQRHADPAQPDLAPVNLRAVRAFAARCSAAEARVLAHMVGGTTRTFQRACRHGAECAPTCPACGAEDTVLHRVLACPAGDPAPAVPAGTVLTRHGLPRWPAGRLPFPPPAGARVTGWVGVGRGGRKSFCPGPDPCFRDDSPVFTDGSGLHPATPYALAAGAAVQAARRGDWPAALAGSSVVFAVTGALVPQTAPATSYGGEVVGILLAARCAAPRAPVGPGPREEAGPRAQPVAAAPTLRLVTDCQSVVCRMRQLRAHPPSERDAWGGFYRGIARALAGRPWDVHKTRAHRTRAQAHADGDVGDWVGNDVADWVAGHALAVADRAHRADRADAATAARAHRGLVAAAVARLLAVRARTGVPPGPPRSVAAGLRAARFVLPAADRHSFQWVEDRRRYQCSRCRRLVSRLPAPGNRCLRAHPALLAIREVAAAEGHSVHLCAVQGRMAGILAVCVACGAYGEERCHLLRRACAGRLGARAFSVRAIAQGRHPHCRASFVERVWALGEEAAAPGLPAGAAVWPAEPPPGLPPEPGVGPLAHPAAAAGGGSDEDWPIDELLAWHGEGFDDP